MGGTQSNIQYLKKISFQDMIYCINNSQNYLIITVINEIDACLIRGTLSIFDEETVINNLYVNNNLDKNIIIYGYNCCDENVIIKYKQLLDLGFFNICLYPGGLFEWLLLQDVYSDKNFETNKKELNLLKYKPKNSIIQ
jgi:hypothetical protein